tara:strand:- start:154 stop:324 length:171 start_codon:yes stop_codon:yes gene_type:complete
MVKHGGQKMTASFDNLNSIWYYYNSINNNGAKYDRKFNHSIYGYLDFGIVFFASNR